MASIDPNALFGRLDSMLNELSGNSTNSVQQAIIGSVGMVCKLIEDNNKEVVDSIGGMQNIMKLAANKKAEISLLKKQTRHIESMSKSVKSLELAVTNLSKSFLNASLSNSANIQNSMADAVRTMSVNNAKRPGKTKQEFDNAAKNRDFAIINISKNTDKLLKNINSLHGGLSKSISKSLSGLLSSVPTQSQNQNGDILISGLMTIDKHIKSIRNFLYAQAALRHKNNRKNTANTISTDAEIFNVSNSVKSSSKVALELATIAKAFNVISVKQANTFKVKVSSLINGLIDPLATSGDKAKAALNNANAMQLVVSSFTGGAANLITKKIPIVLLVKQISRIPERRIRKFGIKMMSIADGISNALLLWNTKMKPGQGVLIAKDMTAASSAISVFMNKTLKASLYAILADKLIGRRRDNVMERVITNVIRSVTRPFRVVDSVKLEKDILVLGTVGHSVLKFMSSMTLVSVFAVPATVGVVAFASVMELTSLMFRVISMPNNVKQIAVATAALATTSVSILKFMASMVLNTVLAPVAAIGLAMTTPVILGAMSIFNIIGRKTSLQHIVSGAVAIELMSKSFMMFSASMLLSSLFVRLIGTNFKEGKYDPKLGFLSVAGSVGLFALMLGGYSVFEYIGSREQKGMPAKQAAMTILTMSGGLIAFSLAMGIAAKSTNFYKTDGKFDMGKLIGSVGVFAVMLTGYSIFSLIGSKETKSPDVKNAVITTALMSGSIIAFSYAMTIAANNANGIMKTDGKFDPIKAIGSVAILGLITATNILFSKFISKDVKGTLMGVASTLVMAVGITAFAFATKLALDNVDKAGGPAKYMLGALSLAGSIGIFAVEFGVAGLASSFIALGGVSIAVMSIGIAAFGAAMRSPIKTVETAGGAEEYSKYTKAIRKSIGGFGLEFAALGLVSPLIALGGVAITTLGLGMTSFGAGMKSMVNSLRGVNNLDELSVAIPKMVKNISKSFAAIGLMSGPIALGGIVMGNIGRGLRRLGRGLQDWSMYSFNAFDFMNIPVIFGILSESFAKMGGMPDNRSSLMKKVTGIDIGVFGPTDVMRGVKATRRMGRALTSLARGLLEFQETLGDKISNREFMQALGESISVIVSTLGSTFATIGGLKLPADSGTGMIGLVKKIVGNWTSDGGSAVRAGIKSVRGLGLTLKNLADGVKEFADLIPSNADASWLGKVGDNIGAVLSAVEAPLRAIGTEDVSWISESKNKMTRKNDAMLSVLNSAYTVSTTFKKASAADGAKAVKDLGNVIKGLAEGVKTMSTISQNALGSPGILNDDYTVTGGSGALAAIQMTFGGLLGVFAKLGKILQETGTYDEIVETYAFKESKKVKKSYIGLAFDSMRGIGDIIKGIGDGIASFNDTKWKDDVMTGAGTAFRTITAMVTSFTTLGMALSGKKDGLVSPLSGSGWTSSEIAAFPSFDASAVSHHILTNSGIVSSLNIVKKAMASTKEAASTMRDESVMKYFDTSKKSFGAVYNIIATAALLSPGYNETRIINPNGNLSQKYTNNIPENWNTISANAKTIKSIMSTLRTAVNEVAAVQPIKKPSMDAIMSVVNKCYELNKRPLTNNNAIAIGNFFTSMTNGITKLNQNKNLNKIVELVKELNKAKKNGTFDNISKNTNSLANAINSMMIDKLKTYSDMISALGEMSKNNNYEQMFNELIRLVEQLVNTVNRQRLATPQILGPQASKPVSSGSNSDEKLIKAKQAHSSPSIDISDLEAMLLSFKIRKIGGSGSSSEPDYEFTRY